jgi:hypothetical protein
MRNGIVTEVLQPDGREQRGASPLARARGPAKMTTVVATFATSFATLGAVGVPCHPRIGFLLGLIASLR